MFSLPYGNHVWLVAQSRLTLCNSTDCSLLGSSVHGDSLGKNAGVGCHALLQAVFPSQGLNPGLLHCRQILYHPIHQGSPRILEWVAYHFSRGNFLTQESNHGLLHCRRILYKLSYPGSPGLCQSSDASLFNMLSRFVIAFLPRRKHLLILPLW